MEEKTIKTQEAKAAGCPDAETLAAYLGGSMTAWERERLEEHAAACGACLEDIRTGYLGEKAYSEGALPGTGTKLVNKAKGIAKMDKRKKLVTNMWLGATIVAFVLSFAVPRYFVQFLVAALILGLKWVSEGENVRMLIMAWKHNPEKSRIDSATWRR